jgi:hypothetical protein
VQPRDYTRLRYLGVEGALCEMGVKLLFNWLRIPDHDLSERAFVRVDISAAATFDPTIAALVGQALLSARVNPNVSEALRLRLDKPKYAALLAATADPKRNRTRKGDFGEIIAAHSMEYAFGYEIPVKKLRYAKMRSGDQPTGIDLVAFKTNGGALTELCYIESKLRTVPDKDFGVEAHDQLELAWQSTAAEYHMFLLNVLDDQRHVAFESFCDFMAGEGQCETTFCIALHSDSVAWNEDTISRLSKKPPTLNPLTVLVYRLPDLAESIETSFASIGLHAADDDD